MIKNQTFIELKNGYKCATCGEIIRDRKGSDRRDPHEVAFMDVVYHNCDGMGG